MSHLINLLTGSFALALYCDVTVPARGRDIGIIVLLAGGLGWSLSRVIQDWLGE